MVFASDYFNVFLPYINMVKPTDLVIAPTPTPIASPTVTSTPIPILPCGDISGNIFSDIRLGNLCTYKVIGDIQVASQASLYIDPGVTIIFTGPYTILIKGRIVVEGIETNRIKFNSENETNLYGQIWVYPNFDYNLSNSIFYYADFTGISGIINWYGSMEIDHCKFKDGGAIDISSPLNNSVTNTTIENSTAYGISVSGGYVTIQSNTIRNNANLGIYVNSQTNLHVNENNIYGNIVTAQA